MASITKYMMTSSNGNIFRVTGPLCGEFTGPGEFPTQRPVTRSFDVFFDLRLNERLSKQPWGWWFETPSLSLWRQCNVPMGKCWYAARGKQQTAECKKMKILINAEARNCAILLVNSMPCKWLPFGKQRTELEMWFKVPTFSFKNIKISGKFIAKSTWVSSGQGKVREIPDLAKVREFCWRPGKKWILRKVREKSGNLHLVQSK